MIPEFTNWVESKKREIEHVGDMLSQHLSPEPADLINDLEDVECWSQRVGELLAEANSWLDKATKYYLPDKKDGLSEADRKAIVEDKVSDIRRVRDILESMSEAISRRISLGQSILRFEKPHQINEPTYQKQSLGEILNK